MNSQMPLVAAKKFVRPLTNECHLHITSRALRNKIHWNDRRAGNRFFKRIDNPRQGSLEFALIQSYSSVRGADELRGFPCVHQCDTAKRFAKTNGIRAP